MKLRIWWTMRRWLGFPRLTLRYADSGWITVDERDHLQGLIFVTGNYEPEVSAALANYASDREIVWDIGANIGSVSISLLQDHRIAEIHAFEPDPIAASILRANLSLNAGHYRVHEAALSDFEERRRLFHGPVANSGLSSLAPGGFTPAGSFEVQCLTADSLVDSGILRAPTLMKIDVEGWEFRVLQGSKKILRDSPPVAIVFEAEWNPMSGLPPAAICKFLEQFGYVVRHVPRWAGHTEQRENFLASRADPPIGRQAAIDRRIDGAST